MEDDTEQRPESLLPYEEWIAEAMREVVAQAVAYAAANGLPGDHHFYITFRTDHPGVVMPSRLRAQYPQEMTIVLQHQFWDLKMDRETGTMSVGLSFGGVAASMIIPLGAITAFVDPHIHYGLRFNPVSAGEAVEEPEATPDAPETPGEAPQVVSLDAFRRRPPSKE
jgi:hypothetical protein